MVALCLGLLVVWVLAIDRTSGLRVNGLHIDVESTEGVKDLITEKELHTKVLSVLADDIEFIRVKDLRLDEVEKALNEDSRIHRAEVYIDANQRLKVAVEQRRPILRIMNDRGEDYYLDQAGNYVAKTMYRAVRVPVITGSISGYTADWKDLPGSEIGMAFELVTRIHEDEFLSPLVEQIHFERGNRIILIPKIGSEKIRLDYLDDVDGKLDNLKSFYKVLARKNGWGKYKEIDISYKNQVIGRKPVKP